MTQFKDFTTQYSADPVIVNREQVVSAGIEVERRGDKHEKVTTVIYLSNGVVLKVREQLNDVREWLNPLAANF